jgi:peptidoglycan/LPS O-acetylase OafA/YrhL
VVNGAVWSIAYEFKCYLLVFACGLFGVFRKKWPWVYLTAMTVLVYLLMSYGLISDWRYSDARCLMEFMIGGCYYLYKDKIAWNLKLAIFAALVLVVGMTSKHLAELFVGTCWGYLIIYFANSAKGLLAFNSLPDVSYGTYLYAWPINKVIIWYWPDMNLILAVLIVLVLSVWVGWVSWEFVELPMLRMKGRAAKRVAVGAS